MDKTERQFGALNCNLDVPPELRLKEHGMATECDRRKSPTAFSLDDDFHVMFIPMLSVLEHLRDDGRTDFTAWEKAIINESREVYGRSDP